MKKSLINIFNSIYSEQGTALIFSILLITVMSGIVLTFSRQVFEEIRLTRMMEDSFLSYEAAQAGLEQGLLAWRYDRDHELNNLSSNLVGGQSYLVNSFCSVTSLGSVSDTQTLNQDQTIEISSPQTTPTISFYYKINGNAPLDSQLSNWGVEIKTFDTATLSWRDTAFIRQPANTLSFEQRNISLSSGNKVRIKPWGVNLKYYLASNASFCGPFQTLESVGQAGNSQRKLTAKIDRASGEIMGIFDFVLYSGKEGALLGGAGSGNNLASQIIPTQSPSPTITPSPSISPTPSPSPTPTSTPVIIYSSLNTPIQLKLNQTANISSEKLEITLTNIQDSRCPAQVMCFIAGWVTTNISVKQNNVDLGTFELRYSTSTATQIGQYYVKISDVYPKANTGSSINDYVITYLVSLANPGGFTK